MAGGIGAAIVGTTLFGSATAATVAAVAINTALFLGLNLAATRLFAKDVSAGFQAREILIRSGNAPEVIVFGETVVGGLVAYQNQKPISGDENYEMWAVIVHAAHECEDITDIYYDDDLLENGTHFTWSGNTATVDSGKWHADDATHEACTMWKRLGASGQTLPSDLLSAFADLTSSHRLQGKTLTVHKWQIFDESEEVFAASQPGNVRAKTKGLKCYDPRLDSTQTGGSGTHRTNDESTWEWTDNPICCAITYCLKYWPAIDADRLDMEYLMTQADLCDELVPIPPSASPQNTEKRYTCNGALSLGNSHNENLQAILDTCLGRRSKVGGLIRFTVGDYVTPDVSLDETDIIGPIKIRTALPRSERYNRVAGVYMSEDAGFTRTEFIPVENATYVSRDNGEEITEQLELDMVRGENQAQRIAFKYLNQSDQQTTIEVPLRWSGLRLTQGTYAQLTYPKFNWSNKVFRVLGLKIAMNGVPVTAVMREDSASAWADPTVGQYSTRDALGNITEADRPVPPPTSMTATATIDGILVEWVNPGGGEGWHYVDVYASPDSSWANASKVATRVTSGQFLHVVSGGTTRYYWVRAVRNNIESDREPNSDTSNRTATSEDATRAADLVGLIPLDINHGRGRVSIDLQANVDAYDGSAQNNSIGISAGRLVGSNVDKAIFANQMPMRVDVHASAFPDGWGGLVWGFQNPVTRFGGSAGDYGNAAAEAENFFIWRYDRSTATHYAIRPSDGTEFSFTPVNGDWLVAVFEKDDASSIGNIVSTMPQVSDVRATAESIKNRGQNRNAGFDVPDLYRGVPAHWWVMGSSTSLSDYNLKNPDTVTVKVGQTMYQESFPVKRKQRYRVAITARGVSGAADYKVKLAYKTSVINAGAVVLAENGVGTIPFGVTVSGGAIGDSDTGSASNLNWNTFQHDLVAPADAEWVTIGFEVESTSSYEMEVDNFAVAADVVTELGDSVLDEAGVVLNDIDVTNDAIVGRNLGGSLVSNPSMSFARKRVGGGALRPISWYLSTAAESDLAYSNSDRDTIDFDYSGGSGSGWLISQAFRVNPQLTYEIVLVARSDNNDAIALRAEEITSALITGKEALLNSSFTNTFTDSEVYTTSVSDSLIEGHTLTGSMAEYVSEFTPGDSTTWASFAVVLNAGEHIEIDSIWIREKPTQNSQDLKAKSYDLNYAGTLETGSTEADFEEWQVGYLDNLPEVDLDVNDRWFEVSEAGVYLIKGQISYQYGMGLGDTGQEEVFFRGYEDSALGDNLIWEWQRRHENPDPSAANSYVWRETINFSFYFEATGGAYDRFKLTLHAPDAAGPVLDIVENWSVGAPAATWVEILRTKQVPNTE